MQDSEGNVLDNLDCAGGHIGFEVDGSTINHIYGLTLNGPANEAGSIGLYLNASAGAGGGVAANEILGGSVAQYQTGISCTGTNGCSNNYVLMETENTTGGAGFDVVLDSNSSVNTFILTGAIAKTVSGTGNNNVVTQPGYGCVFGCPGVQRLANITLSSSATNITFSSIPAGYQALRLEIQARGDGALAVDSIAMQINGDTGNNYDLQQLYANNASANGGSSLSRTNTLVGGMPGGNASRANIAGVNTVEIFNYSANTFEKQIKSVGGTVDSTASNNFSTVYFTNWRSTAAVTSIKLFPATSTNFVAGTRATLYGIN